MYLKFEFGHFWLFWSIFHQLWLILAIFQSNSNRPFHRDQFDRQLIIGIIRLIFGQFSQFLSILDQFFLPYRPIFLKKFKFSFLSRLI